MNISATPFGLPDDAPELARRFAMIMAGLGALVARRFLKMPHLSGFTVLLFSRLSRAARRFHRALTGPQAKVRARRARTDQAGTARTRPLALPSGRGWILRELGWEAAAFLTYLEALLAEIETQAALVAAPRAGRILRPICRMLGVQAALTPKYVTPALTPKNVTPALTPENVTPGLAPKNVTPGVMPQIVPSAEVQANVVVAAQPSRRSPHPGLFAEGGGDGPLLIPDRIFSGI